MAKKGKHLPAAQRQKISEGVRRARAARLAKAAQAAGEIKRMSLRVTPSPIAKELAKMGLQAEPASFGRVTVSPLTPRSSKECASASERLAIDIVALIVHDNVEPTTVVRVVERILRP